MSANCSRYYKYGSTAVDRLLDISCLAQIIDFVASPLIPINKLAVRGLNKDVWTIGTINLLKAL